MKVFSIILLLTISLSPVAKGSDLKKRAETNPLDCASYLQTLDKDPIDDTQLVQAFLDVGRYEDASRLIDTERNSYVQFDHLVSIGIKLVELQKDKAAEKVLLRAFEILKTDEDWSHRGLRNFVAALIKLDHKAEVEEIIKNQSSDDWKSTLIFTVTNTYIKENRNDAAVEWLKSANRQISSMEGLDALLMISRIYQKLGLNSESLALMAAIENRSNDLPSGDLKTYIKLRSIPNYLQVGNPEKAVEIWEQFGDSKDVNEVFEYAVALISNGHKNLATPYLEKLEDDKINLDKVGEKLVDLYLNQKDVESATRIAKTMSLEIDNYGQQSALMKLADNLIGSGQSIQGRAILDFAFQRANQIVYEHHPEDSNGASPGSRKEIYLSNISKRLIDLRLYDQAFTVAMAIEADHDRARESIAVNLVSFAKLQAHRLPKAEIYKRIADAKELVKDKDYESIDIKIESAEVYAILNEKSKAVNLLAEAISNGKESCCYEEDFLIRAGQVFSKYNLTANAKMKTALKEIIESHDLN